MTEKMPSIDWLKLRAEYEAGVVPVALLCARYGIERKELDKAVQKYEWERKKITEDIRSDAVAFADRGANVPAHEDGELRNLAVITQADILSIHRKDVARLRSLSGTLVERLEHFMNGQELSLPCLGSRESPADLLEKLSRVMVRTVQIERQAFNLDAFDPENNESKTSEKVAELWSGLKTLIVEKSV